MNQLATRSAQLAATDEFFIDQAAANDRLVYVPNTALGRMSNERMIAFAAR
jgi:hypothetical protein